MTGSDCKGLNLPQVHCYGNRANVQTGFIFQIIDGRDEKNSENGSYRKM